MVNTAWMVIYRHLKQYRTTLPENNEAADIKKNSLTTFEDYNIIWTPPVFNITYLLSDLWI